MRSIPFSGSLAATLMEDARPGQWAGQLTMGLDPTLVGFVDVIGTADLYIEASLDRSTGSVALWNIATPDYDGYTRMGVTPVMDFQLRVFLADGTQGLSSTTYSLAVGDVDDTPPSGLAFASGGTVSPGVIGATIGTLAVTDPDSTGPYTFTIDAADAWQYEIVGTTLRLKPGITVAISDGPFRALNIEVSDGLQSAAHRLDISVVAAPGEQSVLDILDPWEVKAGFSWKTTDTISALRGSWEIERIEHYGTALMEMVMKDGAQLWLPAVDRIEFLNGTLDMRQHGSADLAHAAYQTVLGRLCDRMSIQPIVRGLDGGYFTLDDLIDGLLGSAEYQQRYGALSNEQFVRTLYRNTEGTIPYEPGVQGWRAALDGGMGRDAVAKAFITWEVTMANIDAVQPHGWWLERPLGAQVAAIYDVALDRLPDREGFDYWMGVLEAGLIGLENLAVLFGRSEEFIGRHSGRSNVDFVRELYRTALDREPDQEGLEYWSSGLDAGVFGRDQMTFILGFSAEKLANFAALPPGEPFFG